MYLDIFEADYAIIWIYIRLFRASQMRIIRIFPKELLPTLDNTQDLVWTRKNKVFFGIIQITPHSWFRQVGPFFGNQKHWFAIGEKGPKNLVSVHPLFRCPERKRFFLRYPSLTSDNTGVTWMHWVGPSLSLASISSASKWPGWLNEACPKLWDMWLSSCVKL